MSRKYLSARATQEVMGKDYASFLKRYEEVARSGRGPRSANENDFKILEAYKKGVTSPKELATKFKVTPPQVLTSLRLAALAEI
jgi:hypothetical protein